MQGLIIESLLMLRIPEAVHGMQAPEGVSRALLLLPAFTFDHASRCRVSA